MSQVIQILAFAATTLVALGYVPQIIHLWKERCSAGISISAWALWVVASILFYSHAIDIRDGVFVALLTIQLTAQITILALGMRYRGLNCEFHGGHGRVH